MLKRSCDLYLDQLEKPVADAIKQALVLLDEMENERAEEILRPLVESGNPAALYYMAQFGVPADQGEFDNRHIQQLARSAERGYPPAMHDLAIRYDSGDMVEHDPVKAALLFKRAAEAGHPHAQWIHGNDLLVGGNGIPKDESLGLQFIRKAANAKFEGAIVSMAEMYATGTFGYPVDEVTSRVWREKLNDPDVIGY